MSAIFTLIADALETVHTCGMNRNENIHDSHRDTRIQHENAGRILIGNSVNCFQSETGDGSQQGSNLPGRGKKTCHLYYH